MSDGFKEYFPPTGLLRLQESNADESSSMGLAHAHAESSGAIVHHISCGKWYVCLDNLQLCGGSVGSGVYAWTTYSSVEGL